MSAEPADRWARVRREGLRVPSIAPDATGEDVRIGLVDTGVNFAHPHARRERACPPAHPGHVREGNVAWAIARATGAVRGFTLVKDEAGDRVGHGTCCAALLRLLAPGAHLVSLRATDDRPTTDSERLLFAIQAAVDRACRIVSVPIGAHRGDLVGFRRVVEDALERGTVVVASDPRAGDAASWAHVTLPAAVPGVIAVRHRDGVDLVSRGGVCWAEGRARPAPGHSSNFWGPSLAAARASAAIARLAESTGCRGQALLDALSKVLGVW